MVFTGQKSTPYIADIIAQHGIQQVVVCPGSRNAPLTLAFSRHGSFTLYSIVDERTAGYFAMGLAMQSAKPVVVICTSGTAVLNLGPAIAEAYFQGIPLLVITADRPGSWIGQQDGQAIYQENIFANTTAHSFSLSGELYTSEQLWFTERTINEACIYCWEAGQPVHINISFSEPLYEDTYAKEKGRYFYSVTSATHDRFLWETYFEQGKKILLLAGQLEDPAISSILEKLSEQKNITLVAENLANLSSGSYIHNASEMIVSGMPALAPDYIIQVGGTIVSKRLKNMIRAFSPRHFIRLSGRKKIVDTFQKISLHIKGDVENLLCDLYSWNAGANVFADYRSLWKSASEKTKVHRDAYLEKTGFSDLSVFAFIAENIPAGTHLHLANSTPVRYAQVVNDKYNNGVYFHSNRGTSGIDGSISTAAGYSYESRALNLVISGDLSFQYDSNAFFHAYLRSNLKLIVINNAGGNIFRIIDGPADQPERDAFFETSVKHDFKHLAAHFRIGYYTASGIDGLKKVWKDFISVEEGNDRPAMLEIFTDPETSAKSFKDLYKYLQQYSL